MKSNKILDLVIRVYDNVGLALWAILLASVIYLVPMLPALRAQYQGIRAQEIGDENALYCKRLNMKVRTQTYNDCLLVLGDFRLKVEQRIYNESDF